MAKQVLRQRRARTRRHSASNPMSDCAQTCSQTLSYCLSEGGDHVQPDHIKAMIDCIEA